MNNKLHLAGQLAEVTGHELIENVNVSSLNEIASFLYQYSDKVKNILFSNDIFVAYERNGEFLPITFDTPIPKDVDIFMVETIEGQVPAGAFTVYIGAFWSAVAAFVINFAIAYALSLMLAPSIDSPDFSGDDAEINDSIYYNGGLNIQNQGAPLPLVFGRCHTSSIVIASQLNTYEGKV